MLLLRYGHTDDGGALLHGLVAASWVNTLMLGNLALLYPIGLAVQISSD